MREHPRGGVSWVHNPVPVPAPHGIPRPEDHPDLCTNSSDSVSPGEETEKQQVMQSEMSSGFPEALDPLHLQRLEYS